MKSTRQEAYSAIDSERQYQHRICEKNNWTEFKTIGEFLLTIECLVGKAKESWYVEPDLQAYETLNNMRKIAAVAVACMEEHGAMQRISELALNHKIEVSDELYRDSGMKVVIKSDEKEGISEAHLIVGETVDKIV